MAAPGGFGTAVRRGALVGLIAVLVVGVAFAAYVLTGHRLPGQMGAETNRALLVAALPDENGDLVAQVIADVDVSGASPQVRSVDPSSPVTVVGTSYDHLRDSYAFGGGAGLAEAYSRLVGGEPLPFIDFGPDAVAAAIMASGGVKLDLPSAMNVFDGDQLYPFPKGPITATTAEFRAILNGAAYLPEAERISILEQSAQRLAEMAASNPGGLEAAINAGDSSSNLGAKGAAAFVTRLTQLR